MKVHTAHAILDVSRDEAFAWLSQVENHPRWATEFIKAFEVESATSGRATTSKGEFHYHILPDEGTGVIDIMVSPDGEGWAVFPTRVVALPGERSAFFFTALQGPGQPDASFESDVASLGRELKGLERRFASSPAKAE